MRLEQLELTGGGTLTLYLRESVEAMPHFRQRPLVLVVPGGGYNHVSPREGDPVALQFAAAGYHTAVLHYAVGDRNIGIISSRLCSVNKITVHFSCIHAELFYNGLGRIIYVFIPFYPEKSNRNRPSRFFSTSYVFK